MDALFGVLHAVVVAPGMLPPSGWLPMVVPEGPGDMHGIELILRLYNQVLDAVDQGEGYVPPEEDVEACASFAAGYVAAAALDAAWIGDAERWTFASGIAYLGGRRDLVPPETLAELDALPDGGDTVRRSLGAIVAATYESFAEVRRATMGDRHLLRPAASGAWAATSRAPAGPARSTSAAASTARRRRGRGEASVGRHAHRARRASARMSTRKPACAK